MRVSRSSFIGRKTLAYKTLATIIANMVYGTGRAPLLLWIRRWTSISKILSISNNTPVLAPRLRGAQRR